MADPIRLHYLGQYASDAAALAAIQALFWDISSTGASNPWQGMYYKNTTSGAYRVWTTAGAWDTVSDALATGIVYVSKNGSDTTGDGSQSRPYLTIGAAYTASVAGSTIMVGPGTYTETLNIAKDINVLEMEKGTVIISGTVVGGAVLTFTPAAAGIIARFNCSVQNLNNATAADVAVFVNNAAGLGTAYIVIDGALISGGAVGTAISVFGDVAGGAAATQVKVVNVDNSIAGAVAVQLYTATDYLWFNCCNFTGGAAAWFNVTGGAGTLGRVLLSNCLLAQALAAEVLDFGGGAACGTTLSIGSSVIAGTLELNNNAGAGIVVLTAGTQIGTILVTLADNVIQKWLGEDEFTITIYGVDANAIAPHTMYTVPGGRRFNPHTARTFNRGAATAAALNYRVNGTGNGSVVAAVGIAAVAQGIVNEAVVQDSIAPAGTLVFDITAGSGFAGDVLDMAVTGKLS